MQLHRHDLVGKALFVKIGVDHVNMKFILMQDSHRELDCA